MPSVETGTIKAADGKTDLYYRIIKPADFDPTRNIPLSSTYTAARTPRLVNNGWRTLPAAGTSTWPTKATSCLPSTTVAAATADWSLRTAPSASWASKKARDQVKGVEFLKSLPYVDGNRIGVHGWSFGGHMTTALMLRYPEIFKVGVAGGPVIDWGYYEVMYGERYMDTPQSNPKAIKQCNLKNLAGNLKGHLMIIHDDHDDTCVPQHTLSFMKGVHRCPHLSRPLHLSRATSTMCRAATVYICTKR